MPAWLVWDKGTAGDGSDCELAWTNLAKDSVRRFFYLWNGFRKAHPESRQHPTQKPVALLGWCLDQLPSGIQTVLDPFAGSGSLALACIARGQHAILIERDPGYFDYACRRVEKAYAQPELPFVAARSVEQLTLVTM
jgi:DNA modification methylase